MIPCGSFSFGKTGMPPLQRVRGRGKSLFQFSCSALPPPPDHSPLPPRGAARIVRTPNAASKWASAPGRGARGREREGKCNAQPGMSPVPPPKGNSRSCLPYNSTKDSPALARSLSPPKSLPRTRAQAAPPASARARLPAARPRRTAGAHPRASARGMLRAPGGAARPPPAAPAAAGFQPRLQPRARAPIPRSTPQQCHLQTQTPDECLRITMLPGLPLSFLCTEVGSQWGPAPQSPQAPIGWRLGRGRARSRTDRLCRRAGEPAPLTLPALKPGRFGAGKEGLAKFTAGELESVRKLRNRKKLGS